MNTTTTTSTDKMEKEKECIESLSSIPNNRQVPNNNILFNNNINNNHNNNHNLNNCNNGGIHFQQQQQQQQINPITTTTSQTITTQQQPQPQNNNQTIIIKDESVLLYSDKNELFNNNNNNNQQVNSDQQTEAETIQTAVTRDYESLITINQIVNTSNIIVTTIASSTSSNSNINTNTNQSASSSFTVLNVPEVPRTKPLVSKLDLAAARRRARRLKRLQQQQQTTQTVTTKLNCCNYKDDSDSSIYTSSDSETEIININQHQQIDLWIRSGPPDKPDYKREKVDFLKIFGLTTPSTKNEVELAKLERRPWLPPWKTMQIEEAKQKPTFHLPYPASHPSLLNRTVDFGAKVHFLSGLGLRTVPDRSRDEYETIWQKIISNRRKRDGGTDTPLSTYCIKAYKKMRKNILYTTCRRPPEHLVDLLNMNVNMNMNSNGVGAAQLPSLPHKIAARLPVESHTQTHFFNIIPPQPPPPLPPPPLPHFTIQNIPVIKTRHFVKTNGLKRTLLTEQNATNVKRKTIIIDVDDDDDPAEQQQPNNQIVDETEQKSVKWPGVHVLMESYHRYTKERNIEVQHLKSRCSYLCEQIRRRQTEADVLERKLRELRSLHIFHDQEKQQIQRCVDQLLNVSNIFR